MGLAPVKKVYLLFWSVQDVDYFCSINFVLLLVHLVGSAASWVYEMRFVKVEPPDGGTGRELVGSSPRPLLAWGTRRGSVMDGRNALVDWGAGG